MSTIAISLPAPEPTHLNIDTNCGSCQIHGSTTEAGRSLVVTVWLDFADLVSQLKWRDFTYADLETLIISAVVSRHTNKGWKLSSHSFNTPERDEHCGGEVNLSFVFSK